MLILFISTTLFFEYIVYTEKIEGSYLNVAIDFSSGVAFVVSLMVVKGARERNDKSFTYLAIGLGCWFCAEVTYTSYQIFCRIDDPYPTIADIIWIAGYFFLGLYFYKTIKFWHETKRVKFYSIVIASSIIAILVGYYIYFNLLGSEDGTQSAQACLGLFQQFPLSSKIFDLLYYLGNGAILIPAFVTVSNLRIRDPFLFHRILISIGVIISFFFGDILYSYYELNFTSDVLYNIGYICFALALIWYCKLSKLLNRNIDDSIQQSEYLVKKSEKFMDNDKEISQLNTPVGIFENISDPMSANDYLRNLLKDSKNEIRLVLSQMAIQFVTSNRDFYNLLLEKAKQRDLNIRILLPYNKLTESNISKLKEDSKNTIKVQYIRQEQKPNQLVLLVDNKLVLNGTLGKNDSEQYLEHAVYSNKESVVLCYINMIEYQSLVSEI